MRTPVLWTILALAAASALLMVPIPWGDSTGAVYGPISFLCEGDWDVDEFPFLYEAGPKGAPLPQSLLSVHPPVGGGDHLLSFTGLGIKLISVPAVAAVLRPWWSESSEIAVLRANQLTVIWTALLILALTWTALRHEVGDRLAALATLTLLFGTTLWPRCGRRCGATRPRSSVRPCCCCSPSVRAAEG